MAQMNPSSIAVALVAAMGGVALLLLSLTVGTSYQKNLGDLFKGHAKVAVEMPVVSSNDPAFGATNPELTIIGYEDFFCTFCKEMQPIIQSAVESNGVRVRYVWKDFPMNVLHPGASRAHEAAHCAKDQGKFWEYHDMLYEKQGALSEAVYAEIAAELNIDSKKFQTCFTSRKYARQIANSVSEGVNFGISSTPYFFIGTLRVSEAISSFGFLKLVGEELRNQASGENAPQ
jgi:protein-disulfide isomerase